MKSRLNFITSRWSFCKKLKYDQCIGLSFLNISEVYSHMDSLDRATELVNNSIDILNANNDPLLPSAMIMAGKYKIRKGDYNSAQIVLNNAYNIGQERNLKTTMQLAKNLLGNISLAKKDYDMAVVHFNEAIDMGQNIGVNKDLAESYDGFIKAHDALRNYRIAGAARDSLIKINNQIFDIDKDNTLSNLQLEYDLEKRESEITLLNQENQIQDMTIARVTRNRNSLAFISILMVLFSGIVYWLYNKVKVSKQRSEDLLLNILPASIATELKEKGYTTAQNHDKVAILFTDFEAFSKVAQTLNPQDLVRSIDCYFKKFDEISAKYSLEKIKTIGDSYLAASGLDQQITDFRKIIDAALEMQKFVNAMLENPSKNIRKPFPMRIGIHLGPVVAGVVGVKKFQYDIWGNTVNVASRIESSSIPGKVAISESLYREIVHHDKYEFEKREKLEVKNIGSIQTYFVDAKS